MNDGGAQCDNRENIPSCPECGDDTENVVIIGYNFQTKRDYRVPGIACVACSWYAPLETLQPGDRFTLDSVNLINPTTGKPDRG